MNIRIELELRTGSDMILVADVLRMLGKGQEALPEALPQDKPVIASVAEVKQAEVIQSQKEAKGKQNKTETMQEPEEIKSFYTIEELRELAIKLAKAGKGDDVQAIISKHGIKKVSATPANLVDKLFQELKALK